MPVQCSFCEAPLPVVAIKAGDDSVCPSCNTRMAIRAFPALLAPRRTFNPEDLRIEGGEASCFFHAGKRAAAACSRCGRFVCALCEVDLDGSTWCPACLADAQAGGKLTRLENQRVLWDSIALATATWPLIFLWTAGPGSLAAIFISVRYWNRPGSLVPRTKWRFVLAILIGLGEIILFALFLYAIVIAAQRQRAAQ